MALSRVEYIGNGTQTDFVVNFALGYFKPADVVCRVGFEIDGIPAPTRSIQIISPTVIRVLGSPAPSGTPVLFERTVTATSKLVNFTNGDILNDENLDTEQEQALYLIHQLMDGRIRDLVYNVDMHKNRLVNLSEPQDDTDAATKGYVSKLINTMLTWVPTIWYTGTQTPQAFGAVGDGIADDTVALQNMINSTFKSFDWGDSKIYRITQPLTFTNANQYHFGHNTAIVHDHSVRGWCMPNIIGMPGAADCSFVGLTFDHNAVGVTQAVMDNGISLILQCNIIWGADRSYWERCVSIDAWDSGFGFQRFSYTGTGENFENRLFSSHTSFQPKGTRIVACIDYSAGVGEHIASPWWPTFGTFINSKQGVGFNLLSASQSHVSDCIAYYSNTGFVCDFGAAAVDNTFSGCFAIECKLDPALPRITAPGGWGFWIGEALNTLQGCMAVSCEGAGFVISQLAPYTQMTGCVGYANNKQGIIVGASGLKAVGCQFFENSLEDFRVGNGAFYPGIEMRVGSVNINDIMFSACSSRGQYQTYGLDIVGSDGGAGPIIEALWNYGLLQGTAGEWRVYQHPVNVITKSLTTRNIQMGGLSTVAESNLHIHGLTNNAETNALGNGTNNGPFCVSDRNDPSRKISMGVDIQRGTNGTGVIQALRRGVAVIPLELNTAGGDVRVGHNDWATGHFILGTYHLWVDSTGDLRIKNGAPTSDGDGVVVGTQS